MFSSNGDGFLFHDRTGFSATTEKTLALNAFPSPADLWARYAKWKLNKRRRAPIGPLGPHLYMMFGPEARAFLQRKGIHVVGERLESFLRAYVEAKELAAQTLLKNAKRDYPAWWT